MQIFMLKQHFYVIFFNKYSMIQKRHISPVCASILLPAGASKMLAHINNYKKHKRDACVSVRENRYNKLQILFIKKRYIPHQPRKLGAFYCRFFKNFVEQFVG